MGKIIPFREYVFSLKITVLERKTKVVKEQNESSQNRDMDKSHPQKRPPFSKE